MGKWLALCLQLLPQILVGIETVGSAWQGHQKKEAAQAALTAIAKGVGTVAPEHATAATIAAQTAAASIDGVVAVLNETGVFAHKAVAAAK